MLQDFRDNLRGVTATILVAIIIVPFAFWGVESLFLSSGSSGAAVTVDGEKIPEVDVLRGIELRRQAILNQYSDIDPGLLDDATLRGPVIDQLIQQKLLTEKAASLGMGVSTETFNEMVLRNEAFQVDGRFDKAQYEYQLQRLGFTPLGYRQVVTDELLANQLILGIQASAIVTGPQTELFRNVVLQERSFSYLTLPLSRFSDAVDVSEENIADYYESRSDEFHEPDRVVVDYIELNPEIIAQFVTVDEDALLSRFEAEKESASEAGNSWRIAHILIEHKDDGSHQALVKELQAKIAGGEDFAELAKEYSNDPGSAEAGGDLGNFTADILPEGFAPALENLAVGQVSGPVETESGTHLIRVLDKTETTGLVFEEERARLEKELRQEHAAEQLAVYLEKLKEETYNIDSLSHAAQTLGLKASVSESFAATGGDGIARYPQVLEAAFSEDVLKHGYTSEVLDLGDQTYVVLKLKEFKPAHKAPLETVRDRIISTLKAQQARQRTRAEVEKLVSRLAAGEKPETLSAEGGWALETVAGATRFDVRIKPELSAAVFSHPSTVEPPVTGSVVAGEEFIVYTLTEVAEARADTLSPEETRALHQSLGQMLSTREFIAYMNATKAASEIKVH